MLCHAGLEDVMKPFSVLKMCGSRGALVSPRSGAPETLSDAVGSLPRPRMGQPRRLGHWFASADTYIYICL